MALAQECFAIAGQTVAVYGEQRYAAGTWKRERRVIHKAEVVALPGREPRDNLRFVVTNMPGTPRAIYDIHRRRGDSENRIKELKGELELGRLSCHGFWAIQLRLLLSATAFTPENATDDRPTDGPVCPKTPERAPGLRQAVVQCTGEAARRIRTADGSRKPRYRRLCGMLHE